MSGGAASIGGAITGIYAGNRAASAQRAAAADAANRTRAGKKEALGYLQPYSDIGQQALSPLTSLLLGKSYDSETGDFTDLTADQKLSVFSQSPAYQFNLTQGMSALNKAQAARGMSLSGGALKEISDYSQGVASNEWQNQINNLFQMAGIGQSTAAAQANIATGSASDLASLAYAGGMGNVNKWNNLSNFGYGVSGMGFQNSLSSGQQTGGGGGSGGGSGTYNSSAFNNAGSNFLGFGGGN